MSTKLMAKVNHWRNNIQYLLYPGICIGDIRLTIIAGRTGQMPAFRNVLSDQQIKLLTAWLLDRNATD